jgi:hypothetical protein
VNGAFRQGSLLVDYVLGTVADGQRVTLTVETRLPERGGVFTGTLTATVNGVTQPIQASLSVLAVDALPATGETPWWRHALIVILLASLGLVTLRGNVSIEAK